MFPSHVSKLSKDKVWVTTLKLEIQRSDKIGIEFTGLLINFFDNFYLRIVFDEITCRFCFTTDVKITHKLTFILFTHLLGNVALIYQI